MDGSSGASLTLPAIVAGIVTVVGPSLALARWVQEKTTAYRLREEMKHSREILEFVQSCPDMLSTSELVNSEILNRARADLAKSLGRIDYLFERRLATAASPNEMAWPRRLLLLYAPRSWTALGLHVTIYIATALGLLFMVSIGFSDDTGEFLWSEYSRVSQNGIFPFLSAGLLLWAFIVSLLWYVTSTRDHWDGALPRHARRIPRSFLRETPAATPELFAHLLLAWAVFDIVFILAFKGVFAHFIQRAATDVPWFGVMLSELQKDDVWSQVFKWYSWTLSALFVVLGYLWSKVEFKARGKNLLLPLPHSLRFLYPASNWQERFSRLLFVLVMIQMARFVYDLCDSLQTVNKIALLLPEVSRDAFSFGSLFGPVLNILMLGALPLYGSYRLGLISHLSDR